jgi:hypothetical protein
MSEFNAARRHFMTAPMANRRGISKLPEARRAYFRKRYAEKGGLEKCREYIKKVLSDPEKAEAFRKRMRESTRRWASKPENREKSRMKARAYKAIPKHKARARAIRLLPHNVEKGRQKIKAYLKTPRGRFSMYKSGAALRSIPFGISFEQFITFWQKPCHYCGDPIVTIGIDRVDSSVGYFMSNIVSCCTTCNRMKLAMDESSFISHCRKIANKSQEAVCL